MARQRDLDQMAGRLDLRFAALEERIDLRFAALDERLGAIDGRFSALESRASRRTAS